MYIPELNQDLELYNNGIISYRFQLVCQGQLQTFGIDVDSAEEFTGELR
jgi:hypothetical protein